jgi:1,4-dihydroxy-2-naphthoyl-CoA hydrolase
MEGRRMAEYLSGSMPNDAIPPEGLNARTASTFAGHIGLKFSEVGSERGCGSLTVSAELLQAANGVVHGGVYGSMIESLASVGATVSLNGEGHAMGVNNNNTDFLRATRDGVLTGEAIPVFRGRQQHLWRVVIKNGDGSECAIGQVRLHNVFDKGAFLRQAVGAGLQSGETSG